ncbi:hypothetical protein DITRI_Ditri02bG0162800 [Diplodiscus trichospermus]
MKMLVWLFKCPSFPLFILLLSQAIVSSVSFTSSVHLCPPYQNFALLQFKSMISLNNCTSENRCIKDLSGFNPRKIQSWKEGTDCCLWDGVSCDNVTGNVIDLHLGGCNLYGTIDSNISLFLLSHLQRLNLSDNYFCSSQIPSRISELVSLTHLDFSESDFSGSVPLEISHLSKLVSLDLSYNPFLSMETFAVKRMVQNMTKLRVLLLGMVRMYNVAPHSLVNLSSSLTSLNLYFCFLGFSHGGEFPPKFIGVVATGLAVKIPYSIGDLKNLEFLNVEGTGQLPNSIGNLGCLKQLYLQGFLTGCIPSSIGNLTQITQIDLEYSNLSGELPLSLGKLQNLEDLLLGENNFTGAIPNAFTNLTKLASVSLGYNNFNGKLPFSLFNLTQPLWVFFSSNQLTGPIPSDINCRPGLLSLDISHNLLKDAVPSWLFVLPLLNSLDLSYNQLDGHINDFQVNSSQLSDVDISNNKLHGPIPRSLFQLEHLTGLSLSPNNITGFFDLEMISKLKNLSSLDLSYNNLSINTSSSFNFTFPRFSSLRLSSYNISEFPIFIKDSTFVEQIDLSNNKIHGHVPEWITSRCLALTGLLFLSNNKLSGEISPSFCNSSLGILDLSNNHLNGRIPHCLGNFSYSTSVLDLRMNNFYGGIPEFENCQALTTLGLNGNQLEGVLPPSLLNCKELEILDVGNNKITGEFPRWLGSLPNLKVLVLRSNKFHGPILNPKTKLPFPMLRIMDASHNEFIGPLPAFYFEHFKPMMTVGQNGSQLEYVQ